MRRTCDIVPVNHAFGGVGKCTGCPLPLAHEGPHRSLSERYGAIEWANDDGCDCCEPDDPDRCFWFGPSDEARATTDSGQALRDEQNPFPNKDTSQ